MLTCAGPEAGRRDLNAARHPGFRLQCGAVNVAATGALSPRRSPNPEATIPPPDSTTGTSLIGVDWGTSNLRVMRLAAGGDILEQRSDSRGAGELTADAFPAVLGEVAEGWLEQAPVLVCGMAGARGRWREAPYVDCPASASDLATALVQPDPARPIYIVPGVAERDGAALSDVMRGEETQVMGLAHPAAEGWVVAPGTHSKWIQSEGGAIAAFRTFVTGELFAAVRERTILADGGADAGGDDEVFRRGVERGLSEPALSAALFSVRVGVLAGRHSAATAADYLSGVLIGAEISAQADAARSDPVTLIGAADLVLRYAMALETAGFQPPETCDAAAVTARGLWRIWEARR